ncbi:nuclear transport factor 2 family protein [Natronoarchaeum mannanilyticum]|uniref:Nuclear transport factor 2 family protein n=1 Tax=Natronoarchaeum mannanilyticum TaxID=926360 RepID=A0AAV3T836_9EURY
MDSPEELVRAFYDALDEHAYDDLRGLLDPEFVQERPDRTFEDREAFVAFMREDRPQTDTTHEIERVFVDEDRAAVQGRLLDSSGEELFRFADVHDVEDDRIVHLRTYTH